MKTPLVIGASIIGVLATAGAAVAVNAGTLSSGPAELGDVPAQVSTTSPTPFGDDLVTPTPEPTESTAPPVTPPAGGSSSGSGGSSYDDKYEDDGYDDDGYDDEDEHDEDDHDEDEHDDDDD